MSLNTFQIIRKVYKGEYEWNKFRKKRIIIVFQITLLIFIFLLQLL